MRLFVRRERTRPTLAGWLALLILFAMGGGVTVYSAYDYLALTEPVDSDVLIIEGWLSDDALVSALRMAKKNHYRLILTTGGPLLHGSYLSRFHTYAELAEATLHRLGASIPVVSIPAPAVQRDRTYASAIALKLWLKRNMPEIRSLNLLTAGPHARRSHYLFSEAFGAGYDIGVIALSNPSHASHRWWRTSAGVRTVIGESIAWVYAALFFSPPEADVD